MELILSPDFWDDVGRQETGADTSRQETDAGISIKLPPGYPDHDPRTALPPIFCRFGGGGYMTWGAIHSPRRLDNACPMVGMAASGSGHARPLVCRLGTHLTTARHSQIPAPAMPVRAYAPEHRDHVSATGFPLNAAVARPVSKKEIASKPKVEAALVKEWGVVCARF